MPFSFTGFGGVGILVLVGLAVLLQVGRWINERLHHGR
ncbi:hypothetical protein EDB95_1104 [Dinghuibacter silviterrae]|uniref:Uncharacterized protein n=1 Tax=Dinghuibacter silviterrae TaxID=1539049 RepID=A0A4R8DRV0_9BACT|nr:hypothetical protein EDB95_1104 [Dinghuibacter silviterrae]